MSRFRKLTHAIWHCQYHVVWVPKYRFRILEGELAQEVRACIRIFSGQSHCEIVELQTANHKNFMEVALMYLGVTPIEYIQNIAISNPP